ncbi:large ribosomal subunit protein uL6-like [Watersipora subatra]|uniref:large ribosomal subunit protein uL6-like n=1 Tax=Watersipora subatra TaxID=2589382 RepID=UPI00355AD527
MKTIHCQQTVDVPANCSVRVKSRVVTVKGPRGVLTRNFKHLQIDIELISKNQIKVEKWFSNRKELAAVNTVCSHIQNMFTGVIKGYRYKMKSVYAHFPINIAISEQGKKVEIRNFLGEKYTRVVMMPDGVTAASSGLKDEYQIDGNDIEAVSQAAARIQQSTSVKKKDIRKFLDGVYVSEKLNIEVATED